MYTLIRWHVSHVKVMSKETTRKKNMPPPVALFNERPFVSDFFFKLYMLYFIQKYKNTFISSFFIFHFNSLTFFPHQNQCIFVPVAPSEYIALSLQPKSSPYRSMMLFLHHYNYLLHLSIIFYFSLVFSVYMFSPYRISFNLPFFWSAPYQSWPAHTCVCVCMCHTINHFNHTDSFIELTRFHIKWNLIHFMCHSNFVPT